MKYLILLILYLHSYSSADSAKQNKDESSMLPIFKISGLVRLNSANLDDSTRVFARVGNISIDTATTNQILANRGLRIVLVGYPKEFHISLIEFSLSLINGRGDTTAFSINAKGNQFSQEQIFAIRKMNGSGQVYFHNIYAVGESGMIRALEPFSIWIRG